MSTTKRASSAPRKLNKLQQRRREEEIVTDEPDSEWDTYETDSSCVSNVVSNTNKSDSDSDSDSTDQLAMLYATFITFYSTLLVTLQKFWAKSVIYSREVLLVKLKTWSIIALYFTQKALVQVLLVIGNMFAQTLLRIGQVVVNSFVYLLAFVLASIFVPLFIVYIFIPMMYVVKIIILWILF